MGKEQTDQGEQIIPLSSSGKTPDFESGNGGSNPSGGAKQVDPFAWNKAIQQMYVRIDSDIDELEKRLEDRKSMEDMDYAQLEERVAILMGSNSNPCTELGNYDAKGNRKIR